MPRKQSKKYGALNRLLNLDLRKVKLNQNNHLTLAVFCITIVILSLSFFNYVLYASKPTSTLGIRIELDTRAELRSEKTFWETFLERYPDYLPGWLELAKIEIQLENIDSAKHALFQAKKIDPNSRRLLEVGTELGLFTF